MMKPGDKVVCIDDSPCRVYKINLGIKKDSIYVISGTMIHNSTLFLYLVGFNMPNIYPIYGRRTFNSDRFRLLDELKQEAHTRQTRRTEFPQPSRSLAINTKHKHKQNDGTYVSPPRAAGVTVAEKL